jgi:hypothetical protein
MRRGPPEWMQRDDAYRLAIVLCVVTALCALSVVLLGRF